MIERSGRLAESLAVSLQRLTDLETMPVSLGRLVRGGAPTAVDRYFAPSGRRRKQAIGFSP